MSGNSSCFPYLDKDVAYLLGLILARGRFKTGTGVTEIVISNLPITTRDRLPGQLARLPLRGINLPRVRRRLDQLIQPDPIFIRHRNRLRIRMVLGNRGLTLKNLYLLTGKSTRRSSLRIHRSMMSASKRLRGELLSALFAASGQPIPQRRGHNLRLQMRSSGLAKQVTQLLRSTIGVSVAASLKRNVLLIRGITKAELH